MISARLHVLYFTTYRGADKSSARPTSRCILFNGENISFDASLVIYIYIYRGADKSLARPGRKQTTATEDFDFHIYHL